MKRIFIFICVICLAVIFGGCNNTASGEEAPEETAVEQSAKPQDTEKSESVSDETESQKTESAEEDSDTAELDGTAAPPEQPEHIHYYSATVIEATCTEQGYTLYQCECGISYKDEYQDQYAPHNYKNLVCSVCGQKASDYDAYKRDLDYIDQQYERMHTELQRKIEATKANISYIEPKLNEAIAEFEELSPTCPQWFLQDYLNSWQAFGSTDAATEAAEEAWYAQYNKRATELDSSIYNMSNNISRLQDDLYYYQVYLESLQEDYDTIISELNSKYGVQ